MSEKFEVRQKGLTVNIVSVTSIKGEVSYTGYRVADYSSGKRKFWTFADLEEAKQKARDIAEARVAGRKGLLALAPQEHEIHTALAALEPTGTRIDRAAMIFADAAKLVSVDEILMACRAWRDNGPGKEFLPKLVKTAVLEFCIRQEGRISERRWRTNDSYLTSFAKRFGDRNLHEITSLEIADWSSAKGWSRRTRNDVLGTLSLFYKDCLQRHHALKNPVSVDAIKREKLRGANIGIFMPNQARKLLDSIEERLRAFLALWMFSGARKEEAGRGFWQRR